MALKKLTYELAVEKLSSFTGTKDVHHAADILHQMQALCAMPFISENDQADFSLVCSNYERYVKRTHIETISRTDFEAWWNSDEAYAAPQPTEEDAPLGEDPLPETFMEELTKGEQRVAEIFEQPDLPEENKRLRKENAELRELIRQIVTLTNKVHV